MWSATWNWIWNDVLPPSFWSILAVAVSHVRTHSKLDAQHEAMKQHVEGIVSDVHESLAGQIQESR